MFLNFSEQCDINNYDDTEAWPSLFDDFVDYEKARQGELTTTAIDGAVVVGDGDDDKSLVHNQQPEQSLQKNSML